LKHNNLMLRSERRERVEDARERAYEALRCVRDTRSLVLRASRRIDPTPMHHALGAPARGNHSLHGYSTVGGGDGKRATQGQDPLPHSDQAEAKLVVGA